MAAIEEDGEKQGTAALIEAFAWSAAAKDPAVMGPFRLSEGAFASGL